MAKGKYGSRIVQDGASWTAEITRKITSKRTGVSKTQGGFSSESEALAWVEKEMPVFLKNLGEQNKHRSEERELAVQREQDQAKKDQQRLDQKIKDKKGRGDYRDK